MPLACGAGGWHLPIVAQNTSMATLGTARPHPSGLTGN